MQGASPVDRGAFHIGEVAGVADGLVRGLTELGVRCVRRDLPAPTPDSGLVMKAFSAGPRVSAARQIRSDLRREEAIAHVHYATSGMWFIGSHPLVIHCHGTDVRAPARPQALLLRRVMDAADLVIAATPDLLRWLPPSARYLPNPVDTTLFHPGNDNVTTSTGDVLVFAALTDVKGAPEILKVVTELLHRRPDLRITAIDHGPHAGAFQDLGVRMVGFMDPSDLPDLIRGHRLVIGQRLLGIPGTSELQAMSCGRPVAMPLDREVDPAFLPPAIDDRDPVVAATEILSILDEPDELTAAGTAARRWVVENHGLQVVSERLLGWYRQLG